MRVFGVSKDYDRNGTWLGGQITKKMHGEVDTRSTREENNCESGRK